MSRSLSFCTFIAAIMYSVGFAASHEAIKVMRRNAELGMPLEKFRALPYPDTGHKNVRAICSDEPREVREKVYNFSNVRLTEDLMKRGMLECEYQARSSDGVWYATGLEIGGFAAETVYRFVKDDQGQSRLYTVTTNVTNDAFDLMLEMHKKQYGAPKGRETKLLQNAYGAVRSNDTYIWFVGDDFMIDMSRYGANDKKFGRSEKYMEIKYYFTPLMVSMKRILDDVKASRDQPL